MRKKIVPVTDPVLRKKSKAVKKVDKKVLSLIKDLKDTIAVQKDPEGIGLAAPQIGRSVRVFVIKPEKKIRAFVNPEILSISKNRVTKGGKKIMEGCLSIPHFYGPLTRPQKLKLKYLDEKGKQRTEVFERLPAQIIQHEVDHLNGKLFIDHLLTQKQKLYELVAGEWEEVDLII